MVSTQLDAARAGGARLTKAVALTTFVLLAASYVINAMDRQVFPVLLPEIREEYGFTLAQGGLLATIFTLGMGLAGVPTGYLLDRLSRKTVILIGIVIYSAFTMLSAVAVGFADMFAYRALSGVGEAMQTAALFSAVGAYFVANRALAFGALNFAFGLGGFLGPLLGAKLGGAYGWQAPLYAYGIAGLVFVAAIAAFVRRRFTERVEGKTDTGEVRSFDHVYPNLYNRNVLLLGVTAIVVVLTMYGYLGLYPTFLQEELNFTKDQAGTAASMFGLGALFGLPAGYIGDRVNQKWVLVTALLAAAVVGYLIFNGPTSPGAQYVLSACEGALGSGFCFVNVYSATQRAVRPDMIGRASGILVSCAYFPASVAGTLFALLVESFDWGMAGLIQLTLLPLVGVAAMLCVDTSRFSNATPLPGH
ncbi:MFS transporter [Streptomyces sp. NPDC098781]|uniref:MFS transporter n=1 Tax=Streptomyces sp. NPDC098781 TaxID=3366097 RepID=UPI00382B180C